MEQNNILISRKRNLLPKRRGVAEVISTLLLVVVAVAGAVILTGFLDDAFVSGSQSVISGTDTTIKSIKLTAYDTRDGDELMGYVDLDNRDIPTAQVLCRMSCSSADTYPKNGGSDFMVIQIENRSVDSIFLKHVYLDNVPHEFDVTTHGVKLDPDVGSSGNGDYPVDGSFSILSSDISDDIQKSNQIEGGMVANILIKLHSDTYDDIDLLKTMRVQLNIGENSLSEFLIETGGAR